MSETSSGRELWFVACSPRFASHQCFFSTSERGRSPPESAAWPTFYRDVLPILQNHCQSCHRAGEIGMMPLVSYEQVQPFARAIATSVSQKKMPPWFADPSIGHFSNDPSLTPQEIATLVSWADTHAPAGDPRNAPPPRQWAKGWVIPQPDVGAANAEGGDAPGAWRR